MRPMTPMRMTTTATQANRAVRVIRLCAGSLPGPPSAWSASPSAMATSVCGGAPGGDPDCAPDPSSVTLSPADGCDYAPSYDSSNPSTIVP